MIYSGGDKHEFITAFFVLRMSICLECIHSNLEVMEQWRFVH